MEVGYKMEQVSMDFFKFNKDILLKLKPSEHMVYRALMNYKDNNTHECWPTQKTLAESVGLSLRTVVTCIKKLKEKGFIAIEKFKRVMGHWNRYKLLMIPTFKNSDIYKMGEETKAPSKPNFDDIEYIPNANENTSAATYDKQKKYKDAINDIESKTCLELSKWAKKIIRKHMRDKVMVLRACTLFNKKEGACFKFFTMIYSNILAENEMLTAAYVQDCDLKDSVLYDHSNPTFK